MERLCCPVDGCTYLKLFDVGLADYCVPLAVYHCETFFWGLRSHVLQVRYVFGLFCTHGTLVPSMSVIWTFPARHNILPGAQVCKVVQVRKEAEDAFSTPHQD